MTRQVSLTKGDDYETTKDKDYEIDYEWVQLLEF